MFNYPALVSFDEDSGQYEILYRDFKNLTSTAFTEEDIVLEAARWLTEIIGEYIDARIPIPQPSALQHDEIRIHLPVLVNLKAALHNAMIQTGTRKADLARKLNQKGPQIDRLLDVNHASKIETLEQALYLLGYEVSVSVAELDA
ncbi:antitoxin HicB [Brenneria goodwinii]|uniref:Antitoxin HicB n=1 Tax=Brenneria goodwinii TaxID=1109412 RepID=A0A0G4JSU7_9GAMM|nr:hypothetical protein [Brenneria goodwinii]ATA25833.1 antitoxin HicB [Brenneria goodwinii]MCG8155932.1 hypothetical protein [Brenneria goodwinii]MCG8162325.1 hypothetical protein [Brenneria goodwinii]MCG8166954.1 hypothetical protein [Brenneria goodwinii]MCG8169628.1 hypothetical protein [Brenneria goodwinii]